MEICLIGLFFLVEDVQGHRACKAQGVIMSVTLVITACYHLWLVSNLNSLYRYAPVRLPGSAMSLSREHGDKELISDITRPWSTDEADLGRVDHRTASSTPSHTRANGVGPIGRPDQDDEKHPSPPSSPLTAVPTHTSHVQERQRKDRQSAKEILALLHRPLNEARLAALEERLTQAEVRVGNKLIPRKKDIERQMMDDPISKIIMQHNDELENLDAEDRDMLTSVAFTHPILREPPPAIWIPSDELGVSDDEVGRTRQLHPNLTISNKGAFFNRRLKVYINKPPPDMSEFALVMGEL